MSKLAKEDAKQAIHEEIEEKTLTEEEIAMINRIRKLKLKTIKKEINEDLDILDYIGFIKEDLKEN